MSTTAPDEMVARVLGCYPELQACERADLLPEAGALSASHIWRLRTHDRIWRLKARPPGFEDASRLEWIHGLMTRARQHGLEYVPQVLPARDGRSVVQIGQTLWDTVSWMPGQADSADCPNRERMAAAGNCLAKLHLAWASARLQSGPVPAVRRCLERRQEWDRLLAQGWRPDFNSCPHEAVRHWSRRSWEIISRSGPATAALEAWRDRSVPLQPCVCDIWLEHILFEGHRVTGIIDFDAARLDCVCVDLARFLGSVVVMTSGMREAFMAAYSGVRKLSLEEEALAALLEEAGLTVAMTNWLTWIYRDRREYRDWTAVGRRLSALARRAEARPSL